MKKDTYAISAIVWSSMALLPLLPVFSVVCLIGATIFWVLYFCK